MKFNVKIECEIGLVLNNFQVKKRMENTLYNL